MVNNLEKSGKGFINEAETAEFIYLGGTVPIFMLNFLLSLFFSIA